MPVRKSFRLTRAAAVAAALGAVPAGAALAACDVEYEVQAGDTYYSISQAYYGTRRQWQLLYQANVTASRTPTLIPGNTIYIPCVEGADSGLPVTGVETTAASSGGGQAASTAPVVAAPAPAAEPSPPPPPPVARVYPENPELTLLTGGGYAPFADQVLPGQGLATDLVHAALDISPMQISYAVEWNDTWSEHEATLAAARVDMGFPWVKPDCSATPDNAQCQAFHFSDPLIEMPIMLFVREDNQFRFRNDGDVEGRSICRPEGFFTHDLDSADRRWISDGKITFVAGRSPADCFQQVLAGRVDAASVNLFLGASVILEMGLRNQIVPLERPISEQSLHVVVSKRHWRGTALLYRFNAGLRALKEDGAYREIVSKHLGRFQSRLQ